MKKINKVIGMTLVLVFLCSMSVFAESYTNSDMGISYTLSDSWKKVSEDGNTISYEHKYGDNESICLERAEVGLVSIDDLSSDEWKSLCDDFLSNSNLAGNIVNAKTGAAVKAKITTDGTPLTSYETQNNVKYFRYEKAYTASGYGYNNTAFYKTCYLTVKDGNLYVFSYNRKTTSNNFKDFVAMLESMSYDNVIKITVNGEKVYPDVDPVIAYDRTLVPIRAIAEKMGYTVGWNSEYQIVTMTSSNGAVNLYFPIGEYSAVRSYGDTVDQIELDVPPVIMGGRTYLPVRAVAEAMNANVNWNQYSRTVEITY